MPTKPDQHARSHRMSPQNAARISAGIEAWFTANARDLPWRRHRNGYTALVAEAMLQQTQVSRVIDAFERFVARFPTVNALACADEQAVLAAWQGLGYYRRARNLHRAAQIIANEHGNEVPCDAETLRKLPGVGRYTAGAISSIVFGAREPIVDGNVQRVLARLFDDDRPTTSPEAVRAAWDRAKTLVTVADNPARLNEGVMELGAMICRPQQPRCDACPVRQVCKAHRDGIVERIPPPRQAASRSVLHFHSVMIQRGERVLLERRPDEGLWAGLWQFPTVETDAPKQPTALGDQLGFPLCRSSRSETHIVTLTHRTVHVHLYHAATRARRLGETRRWFNPGDALALPLANVTKRLLMA